MADNKCKWCGNPEDFHSMGCPDTDGLLTERDKRIAELEEENKRLRTFVITRLESLLACPELTDAPRHVVGHTIEVLKGGK